LFLQVQLAICEAKVALCLAAGCLQLTNEGFLPHGAGNWMVFFANVLTEQSVLALQKMACKPLPL